MSPPATLSLGERAGAAVRDARAGDAQRLADLVELLTPLLWQVARSAGLDHQSAEDTVQQAWLKLLENLDELEQPEAVVGWLATTVRRQSWRASGASRRTLTSGDDAVFDDPRTAVAGSAPVDPADMALDSEQDRLLWHHVHALSPRCQTLLRAISFAQRPDYAAISAALDMPIGSIGPTRGRCLATLRAALLADPTWSAS
ncbi:MAG: sigma-70 family RNA polymerase sigma factor [Austwickia sp.]|jgi:RNA polymerase sigma factor (sigma-70 family)|nr:MAG: sigma-70 family RNA polymerase sigma factor [Austwickia sp.]